MAAQRRKDHAEAFKLATRQTLICAPASPTKSSPQRVTSSNSDDNSNGTDCHTDCHLLRLSPEIRGRIYYYAMENDFHASLDPISSCYPDTVKIRSKMPALMRTCGHVRAEASIIWYSETIFIYRLDAVLNKWLQLIGPVNQKLIRTVRRDAVLTSKRWAEAYIAFTHSRLTDKKLYLAEDAVEVAFWEPPAGVPAKSEVEPSTANAALAVAGLEHVVEDDVNADADDMLLENDGLPDDSFEFDPDLDLENFAASFLAHVQSDAITSVAGDDSIVSDHSSNVDSKTTVTSVATSVNSPTNDGANKKKANKSAKSAACSVVESTASAKDLEKREKAEKKKAEKEKNSPSSLAEGVMSTKSGKEDKPKTKKPAKPKVKKEPDPEKTWAFVRMETFKV